MSLASMLAGAQPLCANVEVPLREGRTVYVAVGDAIVWLAAFVVVVALFAGVGMASGAASSRNA
jgi:apolipoprotein N-acyltransferase